MTSRSQILFLSHGGGPLPLLGDAGHRDLIDDLQSIRPRLNPPSAILVISAHWEESVPTFTSGSHPSLIYDYVGFPREAYQITYPAPGAPQLAQKLASIMERSGLPAVLDAERGFDHGLFVPLKILFPEATIPCLQLSLIRSLNAADHVKLGAHLRLVEQENLLVIGSGLTFHNLPQFFQAETAATSAMNLAFETWLSRTCCSPEISEDERERRLVAWEQAPHARFCHPREEHLLPLHVCYGMAQRACPEAVSLRILNKRCSLFLWL